MIRRDEGTNDRRVERQNDPLDRVIDEALRPAPAGPDLTRSIMGRLGYMRVAPKVTRRQRTQRWIGRSAMVLVTLVAIGIGVRVHNASPAARHPVDVTVPAAITNDLQHHQQRMDTLMRIFRELAPSEAPTTDGSRDDPTRGPFELDEDVNRSAIGPVRFI